VNNTPDEPRDARALRRGDAPGAGRDRCEAVDARVEALRGCRIYPREESRVRSPARQSDCPSSTARGAAP